VRLPAGVPLENRLSPSIDEGFAPKRGNLLTCVTAAQKESSINYHSEAASSAPGVVADEVSGSPCVDVPRSDVLLGRSAGTCFGHRRPTAP
ncbi:hypothetical protein, partial [Cerasicoccus arenae]|uniref:hypothetical protein n=1 Tax=Cerasicoccus arenae TaxID=424488 RepID=UPI001F35FCEC